LQNTTTAQYAALPSASLPPSAGPSNAASGAPSSFPSPTPTSPAPTRPPLGLVDILSTVTPIEVLQDTTTAQYAALRWLETVDFRQEQERTESEILQRYALTVLDFSLRTASNRRRLAPSINEFLQECSWRGVGCSDGATVTSLNWANSGLDGELPAEMGLLRNLTHLDLAENLIGGPLPDALYDLTQLESLYLHQNKLTGTISNLIENVYDLVNLYLSNNELSGGFPPNLGSLGGGRGNRPLRKYLAVWR
jgi:Leucine-rich repeat (LRR) protein